MAKFLNKKERVYDLKLTSYGKHLLSKGNMKPVYYAFFDSEVLYDKDYARHGDPASADGTTIELSGTTEPQNDIHNRIKNETQYIESLVKFREVEETAGFGNTEFYGDLGIGFGSSGAAMGIRTLMASLAGQTTRLARDVAMPSLYSVFGVSTDEIGDLSDFIDVTPRADFFRFESSIGDAYFDAENQQHAPAWKVVTLQGQVSSSSEQSISHLYAKSEGRDEQKIPQMNVELNYVKKVQPLESVDNPNDIPELISRTRTFADNRLIELVRDDLVVYADEINTQILTENFDLEVFEVEQSTTGRPSTGKITRATSMPSLGDKITISDGVSTATFEFINDGGTPAAGSVGVVLSTAYKYGGVGWGTNNRFGTMENFVAAINQSDNAGWEDGGREGTHRCVTTDKCYTGTHDLNVTANNGDHSLRFDVPADTVSPASDIVIELINHIGGEISNEPIIIDTDSASHFSVEGFGGGTNNIEILHRKYFENEIPQVVNGMMVTKNKVTKYSTDYSTDAVEYYFDVYKDMNVDRDLACRGANIFNKDSYYVDLDFDCDAAASCADDNTELLYDIYGNQVGDTSDIC
mgnify:CR=1 FL=1